jgi:hypothetical protein
VYVATSCAVLLLTPGLPCCRDVRSQLKFREVLERNYSYIRVKAQIAGTDRPVAVHLIENVKLDTRPGLREQVNTTPLVLISSW